jgi:hypothetical protein
MPALTLCTDESTAGAERIMNTFAYVFGDKIRPQITPPGIASLPKARREKILRVRQQLAHGTYDLDERFDAVLERILMDIKT